MKDARLEQAHALHEAGLNAARSGQLGDARRLLRGALVVGGGAQLPPQRGIVQRDLCEVARRLRLHTEAVAAGEAAVRLLGEDAVALLNLGLARADAGQDEAALACFDAALIIDPGMAHTHLGRAEILLRRGDYIRGWPDYAWRTQLPGLEPLMPPALSSTVLAWDGAPIDAPLLVVAEQGFGDMIQFARFLPWAASLCTFLIVHAPAPIRPLLVQISGVTRISDDWTAIEPFAAWCHLSDLPRLAGAGWMLEAAAVPYLSAADGTRDTWRARLDDLVPPVPGRRRVGLVWAGSAAHTNDGARSANLSEFASLATIPAIDWISLQKGDAAEQPSAWPRQLPDVGPLLHNFADTAAVLSILDAIVTVDTAVAHLAGAMGLPAIIMLAHRADWRWGIGGTRTWWYPSLRLFRQQISGDWRAVVQEVGRVLF
jgi:hypothetical protein